MKQTVSGYLIFTARSGANESMTLWLILALIPHLIRAQTHVNICMITSFREHSYVQQKSAALRLQAAAYPERVSMSITVTDAKPMHNRWIATGPDCENNTDIDPLPTCIVRQQGLDVSSTLQACYSKQTTSDWIILMEDDFMPCEHAVQHLLETLDTLALLNTKFARFTQRSGGVAFPRSMVPLYIKSVRGNLMTQPLDHVLLNPWSDKKDFVFPVHLFQHIGDIFTIPARNSKSYKSAFKGIRENKCGTIISV
jgi:hypothetical protein